MDNTPRINWQGRNGLLTNYGCGRTAEENRAMAFWQSRVGFRDPPGLTDLPALAIDVRTGWPRDLLGSAP